MNLTENNQKPCLVETKQGFSVSYQNKLLYSKYSPSKLIEEKISSLSILPGTLILCFSPVLDYGLNSLISKIKEQNLSESVQLLICEFDTELRNFIQSKTSFDIPVLSENELYNLPVIINSQEYIFQSGHKLYKSGTFKRILRIDFSAGIQFNNELFSQLEQSCINSIKTFWANRVTLVKFGRKYSHNLFTNLKILAETLPIESFFTKIDKPIIVFGASQSLEKSLQYILKQRNNFYILCVDTALQPLLSQNIVPDGVFIEEAQNVISKAFIGCQNRNIHIFAGVTSVPVVNRAFPKNNVSFYTSLYTDSAYLKRIDSLGILPYKNKPFGSVGLTAVFYGLKFRKNDNIPVIFYGLDFSFTAGFTHARGTTAHFNRLLSTNRLQAIDNLDACYGKNSILLKDSSDLYSTQTLLNYKNLFYRLFAETKSFYDGRKVNIDDIADSFYNSSNKNFISPVEEKRLFNKNLLDEFLKDERTSLIHLRNLLTGNSDISGKKLEEEITEICKSKDYLYLHFPDGWQFSYNQSFLNRIRTEIDFFLKLF